MAQILIMISILILSGCYFKSPLEKFQGFFSKQEKAKLIIPSEEEKFIKEAEEINVHFGPGPEKEEEKKSWW